MSDLIKKNQEDDFKWGAEIPVNAAIGDTRSYRSFILHGVEYSRYDCVCMFREGAKETDIGKLLKIWENKKGKRVKILWLFRPIEIRNFLGNYEPAWNELFLASGEGKGLCSIVPLDAIVGKCSVICTSKDRRNNRPSQSDLARAEYFFSHIFDVGKLSISENFPDKIDTIRVECLFNGDKDNPKANVEHLIGVASGSRAQGSTATGKSKPRVDIDGQVGTAMTKVIERDSIVNDETSRNSEDFKQHILENQTLNNFTMEDAALKDETSRTAEDFEQYISDHQPLKKRRIQINEDSANLVQPSVEDPKSILDPLPSYGAKSPPNNLSNCCYQHQNDAAANTEISQPATRTTANKDNRCWFYELAWEEKLKIADEQGRLVCLDNLDTSFLSSDIQDMILMAFKLEADARIIPGGSFSSPSYGQALVVFTSKDEAELVMWELSQKCLIAGGRPVVASRKHLGEFRSKPCGFPGHIMIEKLKKMKWGEDQKNTVSTSHCSQPNTSEYNLAIQWRALQTKSDRWWKALHEVQAKELLMCENRLKRRHGPSSEAPAGSGSRDKAIPCM